MILDFSTIEEVRLPRFKGGEKEYVARMFTDDLNRIMYGKLEPGASIGMHTHDTGCEIIYILQGTGKVIIDGGEEPVKAGICHYCPKGHAHSLVNDSDEELLFFAVVTQQ